MVALTALRPRLPIPRVGLDTTAPRSCDALRSISWAWMVARHGCSYLEGTPRLAQKAATWLTRTASLMRLVPVGQWRSRGKGFAVKSKLLPLATVLALVGMLMLPAAAKNQMDGQTQQQSRLTARPQLGEKKIAPRGGLRPLDMDGERAGVMYVPSTTYRAGRRRC
jgi:hypothetical protein